MRRCLLLLTLLLASAGCASPSSLQPGRPVRWLIAGTVEYDGEAARVARADPAGVFREVRLPARRADLAVLAGAAAEASALAAAAGFDAVACPARALDLAAALPAVTLRCAGEAGRMGPGPRVAPEPPGSEEAAAARYPPLLAGPGPTLAVTASGAEPSLEVDTSARGGTLVVASGVGTLLSGDPATRGALVEVLADARGVIAYRTGRVTHADFRIHFSGWDLPRGDAVLLAGDWWALLRPVATAPVQPPPDSLAFTHGDLGAAAVGDVTGDGMPDLAAAYRHPFRPSVLTAAHPGVVGVDARGRSAHLGIFTLEGTALWAAGYLPRPVGGLAACDGAVALAYTGLDDPRVIATGAAVWNGLRLQPAAELPGTGGPGCADVDGDGRLDPVVLGRAP